MPSILEGLLDYYVRGKRPDLETTRREYTADTELNRLGSIMGSAKANPREVQAFRGPLMSTIIDALQMGGFDPATGPGGGGKAAGVFRNLALRRQVGALTPEMYAAALMEQPRYARYKQLVEGLVRRVLGEEFPVYRGKAASDRLLDMAMKEAKLPPATAVSLNPHVSRYFARDSASADDPGVLLEMLASPEAVLGLTAKRKSAFAPEAEMLIDPRWLRQAKVAEIVPPSFADIPDQSQRMDLLNYVLNKAADMPRRTGRALPIPGSGAKTGLASYHQSQLEKELAKAGKYTDPVDTLVGEISKGGSVGDTGALSFKEYFGDAYTSALNKYLTSSPDKTEPLLSGLQKVKAQSGGLDPAEESAILAFDKYFGRLPK